MSSDIVAAQLSTKPISFTRYPWQQCYEDIFPYGSADLKLYEYLPGKKRQYFESSSLGVKLNPQQKNLNIQELYESVARV